MQVTNIRLPESLQWTVQPAQNKSNGQTNTRKLEPYPIEVLLVRVGKIPLRDELHTDYISIRDVAKVAQKYKVPCPRNTHRARVLDEMLLEYSRDHYRILRDGVKVTWRTHHAERGIEHQLRFHVYDPANDGPLEPDHE